MPILSLLFFVLMTAGVAHGGWNAGGTSMLSHPTNCPTAGYTAGYLQQCVDLDDGNLWTCVQPTGCVLAAQWKLNSAVASAGVTTFNARAGVVVPTAGDYTATQITNTPAGQIAAATVQAALAELDVEKQIADPDLTTLASKVLAGNGVNVRFTTGVFTAGNDITSDAAGNLVDAGIASGSVANDLVTNAKLANMNNATIKGRTTAGAGDPEDLTVPQAQTLLDIAPKTVLATSGTINTAGNLVDWTQLKNVPAGFADGSDDGGGGGGGTGDVIGPASATDNAFARFDTTTGKLLQNSLVTADDSGNLSTTGALTVGVGSAAAAFLNLAEGTAPSAAVANTLTIQAPVDITTAYNLILPTAPATGIVKSTLAGSVATLSFAAALTDAEVPNNITVDLASAATAFANNPQNCITTGTFPSGVDASGVAENCTDVLTQAEFATFSAALASVGTINAGGNPVDWSQLKNVPAGFADGVDAGAGAGSGDVVGPASAVDNAIARFDTTTGKLLQSSGVTIDDSGNLSTPGTITAGAGGSAASTMIFNEGTAPSAAAANTIQLQAPADVTTAYDLKFPAASATGFLKGTNVANVNTLSFVDLGATGTLNAGGNPLDWSQLKNVPAGFADGTDDGGGTGVTVPLVLLPAANGSDTLTVQATGAATRVRIGTKVGDTTLGALYFDSMTASAVNYALLGSSSVTTLNGASLITLNIADVQEAQINANGLQIAAGGFVEIPDISAPASPSAGFSRVYKKTSGTLCEKNSAGTETCMGGSGTLTAPATLTALTDGPAQLTIRDTSPVPRLRFGTKFGSSAIGAIYFDNTTASALNYGMSGTSTTTNVNASTTVFFATSDAVRGLADSGGITTASQFRFQYGAVDVALQRESAGVVEVNNTTAGQNAPLITGLRDAGINTLGTALTLRRQSSATASTLTAGLGTSLRYQIDSTTTPNQDAARVDALWTTATHASRTAKLDINLVNAGAMTKVGTWQTTGLQIAAGGYVELPDISAPGSPSAGFSRLYKKTSGTVCEKNSAGTETCMGGGGGGTPGGSTTQVQYNNAGAFAGITGATTNGTKLTMSFPTVTAGLDFDEAGTPPTCAAGLYAIYPVGASMKKCIDGNESNLDTDTDTGAHTLTEAYQGGRSIIGNDSFATAFRAACVDMTVPADGDCDDAGDLSISMYCDPGTSSCYTVTKPDGTQNINAPDPFDISFRLGGTEVMRIDHTTGKVLYLNQGRPLKSVEVAGLGFGTCAYTEETIATNKPKVGVFTCADVSTDGIDFDWWMPKNYDGGLLKVQLASYSTHATPSGNVYLNCSGNSVADGEAIPDRNSTGIRPVSMALATTSKLETAENATGITLNGTPAAGEHVFLHCDIDATNNNPNAMTNVRILSTAKIYYTVTGESDS